jgi:hypothetical protein
LSYSLDSLRDEVEGLENTIEEKEDEEREVRFTKEDLLDELEGLRSDLEDFDNKALEGLDI